MEARMNPSLAPSFWELDPINAFQPLCRDILAKELNINSAEVYGVSGQAQFGIDILGRDLNGKITVVGQCKCYKDCTSADIIKAGDEFHEHHERWKNQGTNRFILIMACDLSNTKIQNEIQNQYTRFMETGISFEAWSNAHLRIKLSPYPEIVQRYIHSPEVQRNICGLTLPQLVFTPNAPLEKTLQELREAVRDPIRYYQDIEDLFVQEARKIISVVHNHPFTLQSFDPSLCHQYLKPLIDISEKLVKLSAELIRLDRQNEFTDILMKSFKLLAQDPYRIETGKSFTSGVPEICLYPLALMIYMTYIMGVEGKRKSIKFLQGMVTISFRSERPNLVDRTKCLPNILWTMYNEPRTEQFFKSINNTRRPIATSICNTLLPWLEIDFPRDAYFLGEFVLGLELIQAGYPCLFPALYLYQTESKSVLIDFLKKDKIFLELLFSNIEQLLQRFDQLSLEAAKKDPFQEARTFGFYGNAFSLYKNT